MKKFLYPSIVLMILITLVLNHAVNSINSAGNGMYLSYLKSCGLGTVKVKKSTLLSLPTEVVVESRNCDGPLSGGSIYTAQIWDHLFWLL